MVTPYRHDHIYTASALVQCDCTLPAYRKTRPTPLINAFFACVLRSGSTAGTSVARLRTHPQRVNLGERPSRFGVGLALDSTRRAPLRASRATCELPQLQLSKSTSCSPQRPRFNANNHLGLYTYPIVVSLLLNANHRPSNLAICHCHRVPLRVGIVT